MYEVKETVIEHCEGDEYVAITAAEQWSRNLLKKLSRIEPKVEPNFELKFEPKVEIIAENEDGTIFAHVPLSWIHIRPPKRMNFSEEQKQRFAENLKRVRKEWETKATP